MKKSIPTLATLLSHPLPGTCQDPRFHCALTALENALVVSEAGSVLLLLEKEPMEKLTLVVIERLLRYTPCQRLLLVVPTKIKTMMMEAWQQAMSWEQDGRLASQFLITTTPQNVHDAQICLATVFDIQVHIGLDGQQAFFRDFDVVVLYDISRNPGPAWNQILEIFIATHTLLIGLSALLPEDEGKLLPFEHIIDARR